MLAKAIGAGLRSMGRAVNLAQVSEKSNPGIAINSLEMSAAALKNLQTGGRKTSKVMQSAMTAALDPGVRSQGTRGNLNATFGAVIEESQQMQDAAPLIKQAVSEWVKGEKARAEVVEAVSKGAQDVAVLNAKTQQKVGRNHRKAADEVNVYTNMYSGGNF
jgi:hypothetical protein